ncbi:MAG: sugar ABC transporter permease [Anaerolineae bacterium]|nr:sugar ABC transporter permease [Anaerolineae bacterium]
MLTRRQTFLLIAPFALLVIPFLIVPLLGGFLATLTDYQLFRPDIHFVGLRNYSRLLADSTFRDSLLNVVIFTIISVPLDIACGLLIASALRKPFRGRALLRTALLIPWMISPVAHGVLWHQMINAQHGLLSFVPALLGTPKQPDLLGVQSALATVIATDVWRKAPLAAFLILPGLLAISPSQWDNAHLDGLSFLGRMRHVALPHVRPLVFTVGLLLAGDALGTSESLLYLTGGGPGTRTFMPGLYAYNKAIIAGNWPLGAAASWCVVIGTLLLGLIYLRLAR